MIFLTESATTRAGLNEREAPVKSWPLGPLNAERNCVAFHKPSFQICRCTGQKRQNWYDLAAYASETIDGEHVRQFVCVNLFK